MKRTVITVGFLIYTAIAVCGCNENSPENIKANDEIILKCKARCAIVSREMDPASSYKFLSQGCICKEKILKQASPVEKDEK